MNLIDAGLNLASPRLFSQVEALLERAAQVGVTRSIITGSDNDSNQKGSELAHKFNGLYFTAGFHPHHASAWRREEALLIQFLARDELCVAVGEMGLDYFRNLSPRSAQIRCFSQQLALAIDAQKPVFLHEREAFTDFKNILFEALPNLKSALWHCFTGTQAQMEIMAAEGVYFGITGWICDPERGKDLREVVKHIPRSRLIIETDAPYLTPKTLNPRPYCNEPAFLPEVLRVLAECLQEDYAVLAKQVTGNCERFFNLPTL